MTLAQLIEEVAYDCELKFRRDYSGRGMYGSKCVGVVADRGTDIKFLILLGYRASKEGIEEEVWDDIDICQDSMGLGTIMYFRGVEAEAEKEEE